MHLKNRLKLSITIATFMLITLNINVLADEKINEFDTLRSELSCIKDKNSPHYTKTKEKLEKYIKNLAK